MSDDFWCSNFIVVIVVVIVMVVANVVIVVFVIVGCFCCCSSWCCHHCWLLSLLLSWLLSMLSLLLSSLLAAFIVLIVVAVITMVVVGFCHCWYVIVVFNATSPTMVAYSLGLIQNWDKYFLGVVWAELKGGGWGHRVGRRWCSEGHYQSFLDLQ